MSWRLTLQDVIALVVLGAALALVLEETLRIHAHWVVFGIAVAAAIGSVVHLTSVGLPEPETE